MKKNMGTAERWIRSIGGLAAVVLAVIFWAKLPVWGAVVILLLGISLIVEAALSWCPLKAALGMGKEYHQG